MGSSVQKREGGGGNHLHQAICEGRGGLDPPSSKVKGEVSEAVFCGSAHCIVVWTKVIYSDC